MAEAKVSLVNGEVLTIEGDLESVEKRLSDAARSGQGRLAWFDDGDKKPIGINPAHVALVRPGELAD